MCVCLCVYVCVCVYKVERMRSLRPAENRINKMAFVMQVSGDARAICFDASAAARREVVVEGPSLAETKNYPDAKTTPGDRRLEIAPN